MSVYQGWDGEDSTYVMSVYQGWDGEDSTYVMSVYQGWDGEDSTYVMSVYQGWDREDSTYVMKGCTFSVPWSIGSRTFSLYTCVQERMGSSVISKLVGLRRATLPYTMYLWGST